MSSRHHSSKLAAPARASASSPRRASSSARISRERDCSWMSRRRMGQLCSLPSTTMPTRWRYSRKGVIRLASSHTSVSSVWKMWEPWGS